MEHFQSMQNETWFNSFKHLFETEGPTIWDEESRSYKQSMVPGVPMPTNKYIRQVFLEVIQQLEPFIFSPQPTSAIELFKSRLNIFSYKDYFEQKFGSKRRKRYATTSASTGTQTTTTTTGTGTGTYYTTYSGTGTGTYYTTYSGTGSGTYYTTTPYYNMWSTTPFQSELEPPEKSEIVAAWGTESSGNLFVTTSDGKYGPVCDDSWSNIDAKVACR